VCNWYRVRYGAVRVDLTSIRQYIDVHQDEAVLAITRSQPVMRRPRSITRTKTKTC
jgi:hypothetical protein